METFFLLSIDQRFIFRTFVCRSRSEKVIGQLLKSPVHSKSKEFNEALVHFNVVPKLTILFLDTRSVPRVSVRVCSSVNFASVLVCISLRVKTGSPALLLCVISFISQAGCPCVLTSLTTTIYSLLRASTLVEPEISCT